MDQWLLVAVGTAILLAVSWWQRRQRTTRNGSANADGSSGEFKTADFSSKDFSWGPGHHHGASGDFGAGHHGASGDFGGGDSGGGHH